MIQPGVLMAAERDTLVSQAIHWQEQINGALDRLIELGVDCMSVRDETSHRPGMINMAQRVSLMLSFRAK
jgi:hypothetical protein